jgi:AraC family transcriptional regulator of adaptative response/methylated-DNA-[protein]-cysteine methyltransferase
MKENTLSDMVYGTGLSDTPGMQDLFVNIEGMTPGEYKNGGESLSINYSFAKSPFGDVIVASTPKGICYLAFADEQEDALNILKEKFPNARYSQMADKMHLNAISVFSHDRSEPEEIKLHLKGTVFQLKVWKALLEIPLGGLCTYRDIASKLGNPNASRAVGNAIGSNPVAILIPCHRVIRSSGEFGGYHWGPTRKAAIIGWETAGNTLRDFFIF